MPDSTPQSSSQDEQQERRRQLRGLIFLAMAVLVFSLLRAGIHHVFTPGWWRVW
ncbi:hypothetical protein [Edaphobacter bradus]|uniref:hypothetical protein n=1 Tax=Edaphobacter bradus TaxID=2259016 RepID=UPI0021DFF9EA|nr:hypothetical protein [Edaphobacter bradus]